MYRSPAAGAAPGLEAAPAPGRTVAPAPKLSIMRSVIVTYGRETRPSTRRSSGPRPSGAAMSSALTNWLEVSPGSRRLPPASPPARSVSGSAPASSGSVRAPCARSAWSRRPSGRRRSCGAASKR